MEPTELRPIFDSRRPWESSDEDLAQIQDVLERVIKQQRGKECE